jgi:Protein kinase domain
MKTVNIPSNHCRIATTDQNSSRNALSLFDASEMGGQQSQPVKESTPVNGTRRDEIEQGREECQPCFFLSFLISSSNKRNPVLGSPIPDTPMMERRRRQEVVKQAAALQQPRDLLPPFPHASSGYGGLETEESSSFFSNGSFIPPPGGMLPPSDSRELAEIYEGPDCEEKLHAKYELCEVLGVGSTSTVHRCIHRESGCEYACKVIDLQYMDDKFHSMMIQFHTEIESLKSLRHPGIIQLYDVYILSTQKIYIVMEFMDGGELFDYVVEKGTLTEEEASQIVRVVLSAVRFVQCCTLLCSMLFPLNPFPP